MFIILFLSTPVEVLSAKLIHFLIPSRSQDTRPNSPSQPVISLSMFTSYQPAKIVQCKQLKYRQKNWMSIRDWNISMQEITIAAQYLWEFMIENIRGWRAVGFYFSRKIPPPQKKQKKNKDH